jgi:hypothetical protein
VRHLNAIRKTVAVGSSALLIAGFVSYRAGAFDGLIRSSTPAVEPVEQPTPEVVSDEARPDVVVTDATMFSSSKSIILAPASPPGQSPAVLPGSKSSGVFTPKQDVAVRPAPPAGPPPTPPSQTPPIIGGSKSLAPLIPPAPPKPNSPPADSGPPR